MMNKQSLNANMSGSQVAGAPGSQPANMPVRSFSTSSALTDRTDDGEAVPLDNPKDVSAFLCSVRGKVNRISWPLLILEKGLEALLKRTFQYDMVGG